MVYNSMINMNGFMIMGGILSNFNELELMQGGQEIANRYYDFVP